MLDKYSEIVNYLVEQIAILGWGFADNVVMELNSKSPYRRYHLLQEHSTVWEWGLQDVLSLTEDDDEPFTEEEAIRFLNESDFSNAESMDSEYLSYLIDEWKDNGRYSDETT